MEQTQPSPKQLQAIEYLQDQETNFIGYGGAAFGGKSYLASRWLTTMSLRYPDTAWGLGRKELITLKKTTLKTLFKVFAEMKIKNGTDYNFNQQLNTIKFYNDSEIVLLDTAYQPSDPLYTRFGGYELTGCCIDQSEETDIEAIQTLFTRLGRRNNHKYNLAPKMLETFNPAKNHVYYRYYKPDKEGQLRSTYKFVKSLPTDNPSPEAEAYIRNILENSDQTTIERLIYGNFEYDDDPNILINYNSILDAFTNSFVNPGKKFITTDIALSSDLFVAFYWDGWRIEDVLILHKTDAKVVEQRLKQFATEKKVPFSQISYDADGIGAYLKGFMIHSYSFYNNGKAIEQRLKPMNYKNLKSQCYHHLSEKINLNEIFISQKVAETKINNKFVRDFIIEESQVIKRDKVDNDGKFELIPKEQMKGILGHSPDFLDAMMQRSVFDLKPVSFSAPKATLIRI